MSMATEMGTCEACGSDTFVFDKARNEYRCAMCPAPRPKAMLAPRRDKMMRGRANKGWE